MSRKRSNTRRRLRIESLESRQLLAANLFHNERFPEDVNEDGRVSAIDVLTIVNEMSRQSQGVAAGNGQAETRGSGRMTDVNNDGHDTPLDALMVINRINRGDFGNRDPGFDNPVDSPTDETDEQDTEASTDNDEVADESSDVV
ncbi:MAG: hypothetical protein KDB05_15450, partial [Planctomycetales bacterium]|nr:hypothetical protein [Planctomycetales bacterium]